MRASAAAPPSAVRRPPTPQRSRPHIRGSLVRRQSPPVATAAPQRRQRHLARDGAEPADDERHARLQDWVEDKVAREVCRRQEKAQRVLVLCGRRRPTRTIERRNRAGRITQAAPANGERILAAVRGQCGRRPPARHAGARRARPTLVAEDVKFGLDLVRVGANDFAVERVPRDVEQQLLVHLARAPAPTLFNLGADNVVPVGQHHDPGHGSVGRARGALWARAASQALATPTPTPTPTPTQCGRPNEGTYRKGHASVDVGDVAASSYGVTARNGVPVRTDSGLPPVGLL